MGYDCPFRPFGFYVESGVFFLLALQAKEIQTRIDRRDGASSDNSPFRNQETQFSWRPTEQQEEELGEEEQQSRSSQYFYSSYI